VQYLKNGARRVIGFVGVKLLLFSDLSGGGAVPEFGWNCYSGTQFSGAFYLVIGFNVVRCG